MATTQELYDQAMAARHELLTGSKAITVSSSSGKSVTYSQANLQALESYIVGLRKQLGLPLGVSAPIVPYFG
jgi:gpW protein